MISTATKAVSMADLSSAIRIILCLKALQADQTCRLFQHQYLLELEFFAYHSWTFNCSVTIPHSLEA